MELTTTERKALKADYEKAFAQLMECNIADFELKFAGRGYYAKHGGSVYMIESEKDMTGLCEEMFGDWDSAMHVPFAICLEIAEHVHTEDKYYLKMLEELNEDEFAQFKTAIEMSMAYEKSAEVFWNTIDRLDDTALYGKCVIGITKVWDYKSCVDELCEHLTDMGSEYLCEMQDGIYKTITLREKSDDEDGLLFYIYTVDSGLWEIQDEMNQAKKEKSRKGKRG